METVDSAILLDSHLNITGYESDHLTVELYNQTFSAEKLHTTPLDYPSIFYFQLKIQEV